MPRRGKGLKSGGQPGNLNSLKHGFYSQQLRGMDVARAKEIEEELSEEIAAFRAMLQMYLRRFGEAESAQEEGVILELASRG